MRTKLSVETQETDSILPKGWRRVVVRWGNQIMTSPVIRPEAGPQEVADVLREFAGDIIRHAQRTGSS